MAWEDIAILTLRALIGDLDSSNYTYSDERLTDVIYVSAQFVANDIKLSQTYTVDIQLESVSPDPSSDTDFINFTCLKAACMIDRGNARIAAATDGINAKCGPVNMSTSGRMSSMESLLKNGYCAEYTHAIQQYIIGNASYIRAVLSPFTSEDFDPEDYANSSSNRRDL